MKPTTLVGLLLLAYIPGTTHAGEERIKINGALQSYRTAYVPAPNHKAFAQSLEGAWFWVDDRTSAEMASQDAIAGCNKQLKAGQHQCLVINVDGVWMP